MSYAISATCASKAELELAIRDELSRVPKTQPAHLADIDQVFEAAKSLIDLMSDDPNRNISCSVAGSIWVKDNGVELISLNVQVNYQLRDASEFHVFEGLEMYLVARSLDEAARYYHDECDGESFVDEVAGEFTQLDDDHSITLCLSEDEPAPITKTCREFIDWQFPEHNGPFVLAQEDY